MEFTVDMLKRASARRTRSDQIDKHIISLATGIPYNELGQLSQREYGEYLNQLLLECTPVPIRLHMEDDKWVAQYCTCECLCDECGMFISCVFCDCGGSEIIRFRDVLQNDIERVNASGNPDYPALIEILLGENIRDWPLRKYKMVEMAVARSMMSPLPLTPTYSTSSEELDSEELENCSNSQQE